MKLKVFSVPATQDPFINTPLISAGTDPVTGEERFWISTWNENCGCLGALLTPSGKYRIYRIPKGPGIAGCGGYSACLTDNDTIWVVSDLQAFCRLTLSTGECVFFDTGAPSGLVFTGMQYDPSTKKLLAFAFHYPRLAGVSFDTALCRTVRLYDHFTDRTCIHGGFANGDGTYTVNLTGNGPAQFYRWDPVREALEAQYHSQCENCECAKTIRDSNGRVYVPHHGWLDTETDALLPSPRPERELQWFGRHGSTAFGSVNTPNGLEVCTWDIPTGKVCRLCGSQDVGACAMARDGSILVVTVYGQLLKFSPDGKCLLQVQLDSASPGLIDCMIRVDAHTLLGTPFITQRFWLLDTDTGKSRDMGRAAPGGGEILKTWNIGGKIYMASYSNGYLTEFDPKRPGMYPENPRVLTQAPEGMRPVADARRGSTLYYACTHHYGTLGCTLTKYDTEMRQALHRDDPISNQHIISLSFDLEQTRLFGGTTFHSDCDTTTPGEDRCYIAELSPDTLEVLSLIPAPQGCAYANVIGALDGDHLLLTFSSKEGPVSLWQYLLNDRSFSPLGITLDRYNAGAPLFIGRSHIHYAGEPGLFVIKGTDKTRLCRIGDDGVTVLREIFDDPGIYGLFLDGKDAYAATADRIYIAEDALVP